MSLPKSEKKGAFREIMDKWERRGHKAVLQVRNATGPEKEVNDMVRRKRRKWINMLGSGVPANVMRKLSVGESHAMRKFSDARFREHEQKAKKGE